MAYCTNCGVELTEGAKFCANCGIQISKDNTEQNKRKEFFDGEVRKCPNCGEAMSALSIKCPNCGHKKQGTKGSDSINALIEKIENASSEEQRVFIIKNFPVPNNEDDIVEFMLLAYSSFDVNIYVKKLEVEDVMDAWLAKMEQCYQKAKIIADFGEKEFSKIEELYLSTKTLCQEKEDKENKEKTKEKKSRDLQEKEQKRAAQIARFVETIKKNKPLVIILLGIMIFVIIPIIVSQCALEDILDKNRETFIWDEIILSDELPVPEREFGSIHFNKEDELWMEVEDITRSGFKEYVNRCKEAGYTIESTTGDDSYDAYNADGYKLTLTYSSYYEDMTIKLNAPLEQNPIDWSIITIISNSKMPLPPSNVGEIISESEKHCYVYVSNVTKEQYDEYVNSCVKEQYCDNYQKSEKLYSASRTIWFVKYSLKVEYVGFNTIYIEIRR